ncbi:MAG: rod-binding protein [Hyphomicrobiales bacterium]|nr:rod-binding protein [Hyphomicrobiales bacterium]
MITSITGTQSNLHLTSALAQAQPAAPNTAGADKRFEDVLADQLQVSAASKSEAADAAKTEGFKKFEAFILQTFIQELMPEDAESVYGQGFAGEVWKSMMAEKIAGVVADSGGIGLADVLERANETPVSTPVEPVRRW